MRHAAVLLLLACASFVWAADTPTALTTSTTSPVPVLRAASALPVDKIWSAVVFATNPAAPKDAPEELREFAPRLKRVFGYSQFQLIGAASEKIDDQTVTWLVPSQSFWLGVKARRAVSKEARGGYLLNLQLFQDKRPLLETEAKLAPGSPLFIRGPQYGQGQLIIVLQVQR